MTPYINAAYATAGYAQACAVIGLCMLCDLDVTAKTCFFGATWAAVCVLLCVLRSDWSRP